MSAGVILSVNGMVNLQASLAAHTWGYDEIFPHHPICCRDELAYDETGLRCPHAKAPPTDRRTMEAINHSIALLLIELASKTL